MLRRVLARLFGRGSSAVDPAPPPAAPVELADWELELLEREARAKHPAGRSVTEWRAIREAAARRRREVHDDSDSAAATVAAASAFDYGTGVDHCAPTPVDPGPCAPSDGGSSSGGSDTGSSGSGCDGGGW